MTDEPPIIRDLEQHYTANIGADADVHVKVLSQGPTPFRVLVEWGDTRDSTGWTLDIPAAEKLRDELNRKMPPTILKETE